MLATQGMNFTQIIERSSSNGENRGRLCRIVHKNDVLPAELASDIPPGYCSQADYHRVFYGEIMRVCATRDIEKHEQAIRKNRFVKIR